MGNAFSDAAETYDQVVEFALPFGRALVAAADLDMGAKVLDIACGRGACLRSTPSARTARCSASTSRRGWSSSSTPSSPPRASATPKARVGDAEELDLPDGSFDVVTGGFMIFFPPDPPRVIEELRRVLAPGGTLALCNLRRPVRLPVDG